MYFGNTQRHPKNSIVWLDLGELNTFRKGGLIEQWQDHGLGVLRTICHNSGIETDVLSTRSVKSWDKLRLLFSGYRILLMNVRSYTFPFAVKAARLFKNVNPDGVVMTGGIHASVALDEMINIPEFDYICNGPGENIIVPLLRKPDDFPRIIQGRGAKSLTDWPNIDRTLWPKPVGWRNRLRSTWPLEPSCGWGPPPVASIITSRVCPWQCAFCNEASYLPNMKRKSVDQVIGELNRLDERYGPIGSVVIHDSMFFTQPHWLEEWLIKYPRDANSLWPYWAAGRSDTIRQWPDLFESLIRETNWNMVSIGFESGSDPVLRLLNKECTEADNYYAIDLLNRIGDDMEKHGLDAPKFWANIMLGIPGETHEDVLKTMRMVRLMKRKDLSVSYYAPYPGSILGDQLIAEGKSLMPTDAYHRYPGVKKVRGVDYDFLTCVLDGQYDDEISAGMDTYKNAIKNKLDLAPK